MSGTGSIASAGVGSKGVTIDSLQSAHPNYILGNATLNVTKRPVNLSGSRTRGGTRDILASELSFGNLAASETLTLSGQGTIPEMRIGPHTLNLFTLSMTNGSGSTSNYTFTGGSLIFTILNPLPPFRPRAIELFLLRRRRCCLRSMPGPS